MNVEILKKIRRIKLYTNRLMHSSIAGDYVSAFKGAGLEFDQLREYQLGDDIRFIDWNSSAKMNRMMVKQFIEERDRTVIIAVDGSASSRYSSTPELRIEMAQQLAGALTLIAANQKDRVGLALFSQEVERWIPPSRGRGHVSALLEELFCHKFKHQATSIQALFRFLLSLKKKRAIVLIISDWIDDQSSYEKLLNVARIEYDIVPVRLFDRAERFFPNVGLLEVQDIETGKHIVIDGKGVQLSYQLGAYAVEQQKLFARYGIDTLDLEVGQSFILPLMQFFNRRIARQV